MGEISPSKPEWTLAGWNKVGTDCKFQNVFCSSVRESANSHFWDFAFQSKSSICIMPSGHIGMKISDYTMLKHACEYTSKFLFCFFSLTSEGIGHAVSSLTHLILHTFLCICQTRCVNYCEACLAELHLTLYD